MIDAFPLQWPAAWPRTSMPERHPSMVRDFNRNRDDVIRQLDLLGASSVVVSTNMQARLDGTPRSGQREPSDSGVAVYFNLNGEQQCIPCDKWDTVSQNLRAVALTIEALRGLDRWGAKEMVNAAFRGFKALPANAIVTPYKAQPWHEVLEVVPTASPEVIKAAYRQKMLKAHPDQGGSSSAFEEVQRAYKESGV
ncbi:J domain-containing protein [Streptomyces sp. BBFR109]|uniref:J domain-containing protein n=1 Tax=Streptomyces sp. BBFR109 TaxID=3448172 RepID=UPI003F76606C